MACKFVFFASSLEEYAKAYSETTDVASTAQDLLRVGERINYNERIMNARNGFTASVERDKAVIEHYGTDELKTLLSETGLGNHAEVIKLFSKVGQDIRQFVDGL